MNDWVFTATCITCGEAWQSEHKCSGVDPRRIERRSMHDDEVSPDTLAAERIAELERQLAAMTARANKAEEDRDFWKGRSELMQRQRNMRLSELTVKDAEIAAANKREDDLVTQAAKLTDENLGLREERDALAKELALYKPTATIETGSTL